MFEGIVRQLLLGYLGRYIKDFEKKQLKITLEEIVLEDVELILEAFDYLQLPVALKRGHVGKLSIGIPWKKLGWEYPIIICLEDVFFCAGPRDDHEWNVEAVERRELAAKKAKLAAAELAKLSRRVSDNQAGQSLISHVTGRILDSIQVSMKNVHIVYCDMQQSMLFGLRFTSLTIGKQNTAGSLKARGDQVNKTLDIHGLGIHCSTLDKFLGSMGANGAKEIELWQTDVDEFDYVMIPFDLSLQVTKSGKLDLDAPQYSVTAELTKLVITINPAQLQYILMFSDYICTCQLREKYGRYRPWDCPLSKKLKGWQKIWWRYAQESVISDVRVKLKKTSWRYLGRRLDHRRKYVNLYKVKLNFLQREQPVDQDLLYDLEQMEKDSDLEDILRFRSIAEQELEVSPHTSSTEATEGSNRAEKFPNDENSTGRARGWLNWLSRGVLGAGGTADSSQFSGVVSDEVIKDICEATKFQPMPSANYSSDGVNFLFAVNFHFGEISLLIKSVHLGHEIAESTCSATHVEVKVWEDSTAIVAKIGSFRVINSSNQIPVLQMKEVTLEEIDLIRDKPPECIEVNISMKNQMAGMMVKVTIQPVEVYCDLKFLLNLVEFYHILESHTPLQQRILLSLNGIRDAKCRLQYKTEYVMSSRQRVIWDVAFVNLSICLPWENVKSGECRVVMQTKGLQVSSKLDTSPVSSDRTEQCLLMGSWLQEEDGILNSLELNDLYDKYEVRVDNIQVMLVTPCWPLGLLVVEKFSASASLAHCIVPDEMILKQIEAHLIVSSLHVHFSVAIYAFFLSLAGHFHFLFSNFKQVQKPNSVSMSMRSSFPVMPFCFSLAANFELFKLEVDLDDDRDNCSVLLLSINEIKVRFVHNHNQDCWISTKDINISNYRRIDESKSNLICISRIPGDDDILHSQQVRSDDCGNVEWNASTDGFIILHYVVHCVGPIAHHNFTLRLSNIEFHCYPYIVQLLVGFCDKLMVYDGPGANNNYVQQELKPRKFSTSNFQRFGVSNFCQNGVDKWASIPLEQYPFASIRNSGCLHSLDNTVSIPEWTNIQVRDQNNFDENENVKAAVVIAPETMDNFSTSNYLDLQFNVTGIKVHFHDLTCLLGSITLPVAKASVISHADQFDVLFSVEGITLFSDWWTCDFYKFLWGPSLPNQLSVLNVRVRKRSLCLTNSDLEVSFGIQHVCCILPSEFLAVLIGYFSLPDWRPNDSKLQSPEKREHVGLEKHGSVVYKFEILESILILPVESNKKQFLNLDLQQLYCSFIDNDAMGKAFIASLSEFSIPEDKIAERAQSLNLFGRDLHLSVLTLKDFDSNSSISVDTNEHEVCTLVQSLNADFWLRLPVENKSSGTSPPFPTCILIKIACCEFAVEDNNFLAGFGALSEVIDQCTLVDKKSRLFTCDIPGYLQSKNTLKINRNEVSEVTRMSMTEIWCCVNSLSVNLISLGKNSISQNLVGKMVMGFDLSATLKNEKLSCFSVNFSTFLLSALPNSSSLAKCLSDSSSVSVLKISLSNNVQNEINLFIDMPSLEIWFHQSEWLRVIDHMHSCIIQLPQGSVVNISESTTGVVDLLAQKSLQSQAISASECDESAQDVSIVVRSKNIGLSCHIPLWVCEDMFAQADDFDLHNINSESQNAMAGGKDSKFLTIIVESRSTELHVCGCSLKFNTKFEKANGSVGISECGSIQSWPFFRFFQVGLEIQICDFGKDTIRSNVEVNCDAFDVWLSQQVFYFWQGIKFGVSEGSHSDIKFGTMDLKLQLKKVSLLLTDGRSSCYGPLIELLMRNLCITAIMVENFTKFSTVGDLLVNYNNIHKVLWEPFLEPWSFQTTMIRNHGKNDLLDSGIITDIHLESTTHLNINITQSLCEVSLRAIEMIEETRGLVQLYEVPKSERFQNLPCVENLCVRRYASYTIHNMTSLPFVIHVYQGLGNAENIDLSTSTYENSVPPGASVPIYIDGTLEEQAFSYRMASSSEGLGKKPSNRAGHYFMTIHFEGTSERSEPISMDLVGITYFEVNFSNDYKRADANVGLLVPVVFDVSLQRYSKLIRLYSTVIFKNLTSLPLELRFDIPFGMSSKIVDPIYPGKEFPLPLHLAEAGHMRWRPLGNNYLWSEVHNLSKILSTESTSGFMRSLSCNPSHPSNYLFRCCISVQDISLSSSRRLKGRTLSLNGSGKQSSTACNERSKPRFIHWVTLTTPLTVKSYLPCAISVTVEGGGATLTCLVKEVEASFFHVDPSHDLVLTFSVDGFGQTSIRFPRAETFCATAKPTGTVISQTETMSLSGTDGLLHVAIEKILDSLSGARELCVSVPILLYNCTGFPLILSRSDHEVKGNNCIVPTCYELNEQGLSIDRKDGLHILPSEGGPHPAPLAFGNKSYLSKNHIISSKELVAPFSGVFFTQSSISNSSAHPESDDQLKTVVQEASVNDLNRQLDTCHLSDLKFSNVPNDECLQAKPVMYSPDPSAVAGEIVVRVCRYHAECPVDSLSASSWSNPFFLVAPSGSTAVSVPQLSTTSAAVISVTSHLLDIPLMGRTRAVTFQPRYVISNACSKPLCYKQKGTDFVVHLGIGEHSHLPWIDTTRELLLAVRFDEPGWQWSGSFLPDHLGDTQVKMRNYVSGALNIVRIEVQNADVIQDEKIIGNAIGKSGTNLILLSDDDTGFVPYRIDNFSNETLRIYQQKCETLETIVHPYTSCPYAWDEPFYPHRLVVEIPGKRTLGSYTLDDVRQYPPVQLASTSMSFGKHERKLFSSVHAEGAMKVLNIIDSSCHVLEEVKSSSSLLSVKRKEREDGIELSLEYNEKLCIKISFIGISLIDSYQELLYASAKDIRIDLLQNMEHQSFSFKILTLQIDNQLRGTPYPVVLSFDEDFKGSLVSHMRNKDSGSKNKIESVMTYAAGISSEPQICLMASKWRKEEMTLVSFENISLRIGDLCLELDLELLLKLLEFFKANPLLYSETSTSVNTKNDARKLGLVDSGFSFTPQNSETLMAKGDHQFPKAEYFLSDGHSAMLSLPEVLPIGAPWQKIYLLARRQKKIYVEAFSLAPVKMTLSFSSNPWMLKTGGSSSGESLIHRSIMALADVEGAQIRLRELNITHHMASWESIQEILLKHYSKQFLHEMYKVLGSAGVIGNPVGFARKVGYGVKEFLSVPAKGVLQRSPSGLISGMAQGTSSLLSNTLYAISDTATQFSKAAHKGILALTYDNHDASNMEQQMMVASSQSKGVINELFEGLTYFLQSPIKGAEKHGLPGLVSGIVVGVTGLVAKPTASVLQVTGRTAQGIRNRSRGHRMGSRHYRTRLPRPLSEELPLRPYCWEEAIGFAVLLELDASKFKDEVLVMCKPTAQAGEFVVLTETLILIIECSSLVHLGKPEFVGIIGEPKWKILVDISLESVIHVDVDGDVVHIVGSNSKTLIGQTQPHQRSGSRMKQWSKFPTSLPLFQTDVKLASNEEAEYFLRVLLSTLEQGREQGWGNVYLLHQSNLKKVK